MNLAEADARAGSATDPGAPVVVGWSEPERSGQRWSWAAVAVAVPLCVGVGLRLWSSSPLWLDEAQAVAIARLPLGQLFDALRQDGAPPLYYLLLHGWIRAFGTGAGAVRLLSVVMSLGALVLAWRAALHLGGRRVAVAAVLLLATSPFAIRYATEARMYSLILVLVLGALVLVLDPRPPSWPRAVGLSLVVAALLLTHYWSFFVVGAMVIVLGWRLARQRGARAPAMLLGATLVGFIPMLPWVPSLLVQLRHTGAPWAPAPGMAAVEMAMRGFSGGDSDAARLLELLLLAVVGWVVLSQFTARLPHGVASFTRDRPWPAATLAGLGLATLLLGGAATRVSGTGFAARHAAVAFPPLLLAVAAGLSSLEPARLRRAVLAGAAVLGLVATLPSVTLPRTQAAEMATAIEAGYQPGDLVLVCPDQLAPALHRLLPSAELTVFPSGSPPDRVDWTDYQQRVRAGDPLEFAQAVSARAGAGAVWMVFSAGYVGVGSLCAGIQHELARMRPGEAVVLPQAGVFEKAQLWKGPAPGTLSSS